MPAIQSCFIEPIWTSSRPPANPAGEPHAGLPPPRVSDRLVFDKLVQVAVFACATGASLTHLFGHHLRRRRDEWIGLGVMEELARIAEEGYDRLIGLQLEDIVVDGCITKAPCGGEMAGGARSIVASREPSARLSWTELGFPSGSSSTC